MPPSSVSIFPRTPVMFLHIFMEAALEREQMIPFQRPDSKSDFSVQKGVGGIQQQGQAGLGARISASIPNYTQRALPE